MEFEFKHRDFYPDTDGEFPNQTINTKSVVFKDGVTWDKVVDEFLSFLSGVYGYDIRDNVKYETFSDRMATLTEDYPEAFDDEEDPFETQGREFQ